MDALTNDEVMWYVATRKDTGAHFLLNENYIEDYESEFERIREYDSVEQAKEALDLREKGERVRKSTEKKTIKVSKIRGDIRKGNLDEDRLRAEIEAELALKLSSETQVPDDINLSEPVKPTRAKRTSTKPTKEKLD